MLGSAAFESHEAAMDPLTILAAFGPLAVDLGKSLIGRFITPAEGYRATNVDEAIRLRQSEIALFNAVSDAGGSGTSFPWVEAIRQLMRPAVAGVVLSVWAYEAVYRTTGATPEVTNFAAAVGFYLFGDRTLFYSTKAKG